MSNDNNLWRRDFVKDDSGRPLPGFILDAAHELYGNSLSLAAAWKGQEANVGALAGKSIGRRFVARDADLFSYRFAQA